VAGAVRGDLGTSWATGRPVAAEIGARLPATLRLTAAAVAVALGLALVLGVLAAIGGRWVDAAVRAVSAGALVLPGFVLALLLLHVVVLRLGHFRVVADGTWSTAPLPALTLALGTAATWSRLLRAGLLTAHGAGHVEVARARGAGRLRILVAHDLPNAAVPFLTAVGTGVAALLGGAPIIETVFTWPGVGRYAVQGITARDLPVVQAYTLLAISAYVAVSLLVDLAVTLIDPRTADRRG